MALIATVTGSAPTGTVQFKHGATVVSQCSAVPLNGSRQAVCADVSSLLVAGNNAFSADYSGNAANLASSGSTSAMLTKAASTTQLESTCLTTFTAGQPFSMTATVAGYVPTGVVAFKASAIAIAGCDVVALDASSQATCGTTAWSAGSNLLTANYGGDGFNLTSVSSGLMIDVLDPDDVVFRTFSDEVPVGCPAR